VRAHVVRVPVPAVRAVGQHDLRTHLRQHLDQRVHLLVERLGPGERPRVQALRGRRPDAVPGQHHARVPPAAGTAEEAVVGQPERRARPGQLPDPVAAQLVGPVRGQLGELRRDDLALLPERAGDQRDRGVRLRRVVGDRAAGVQRLVVGMGVHQQQPPRRRLRTSGHGRPASAVLSGSGKWQAAT
jgi:hypothetical protein